MGCRPRKSFFLANGHRVAKLALIRGLLDQCPPEEIRRGGDYRERLRDLMGIDLGQYPCCAGTPFRATPNIAGHPFPAVAMQSNVIVRD